MSDGMDEAVGDERLRAEAEDRAHDRIAPTEPPLGPVAALELYVEAFMAGAEFADKRRRASR